MLDRWFSALSVRSKILSVVIVTMLLAVTLSGLAFIAFDLRQQKQQMLDNFTAIAQVTAQRSSAAVGFFDPKRGRENLQSLALVEGARAACLHVTSLNKALASWPTEPLSLPYQCLTAANTQIKHQPVSNDSFTLALPVVVNSKPIGTLTVYASFQPIYQRARRLALSLLMISAIASVVAFAITQPMQKKIYLPIIHLGEVARRAGKQMDYSVRAKKEAPDELGDTVDAFNNMMQQLEDDKSKLELLAYYDNLTGLPNRRLFMEKIARAIAHSRAHKKQFGLIFIDLDNFKWVNDNLGHDRGDWLLKIFAERTQNAVRKIDTVCRLGGDEFTVVLLELDNQQEGEACCERILEAIKPPIQLGEHSHQAGASLGLAIGDGFNECIDSIIKKADLAVYEAKAAGKNTYRTFKAVDT